MLPSQEELCEAVEAARPLLVKQSVDQIVVTIATILVALENMGGSPASEVLGRVCALTEIINDRVRELYGPVQH